MDQMTAEDRAALEARWLDLTRQVMPAEAQARRWPVVNDHCFQRILLDHACGGCWYDHIPDRPAYKKAPANVLLRAVAAGEAALKGRLDLHAMNRASLVWRGKA